TPEHWPTCRARIRSWPGHVQRAAPIATEQVDRFLRGDCWQPISKATHGRRTRLFPRVPFRNCSRFRRRYAMKPRNPVKRMGSTFRANAREKSDAYNEANDATK